jgi:hypothetical protein
MSKRTVHSRGIVVCGAQYLEAMRQLQAEHDAGRPAERNAGFVDHVISMEPMDEEKYARCEYCSDCHLVIVARDDVIPSNEIPEIAKR